MIWCMPKNYCSFTVQNVVMIALKQDVEIFVTSHFINKNFVGSSHLWNELATGMLMSCTLNLSFFICLTLLFVYYAGKILL